MAANRVESVYEKRNSILQNRTEINHYQATLMEKLSPAQMAIELPERGAEFPEDGDYTAIHDGGDASLPDTTEPPAYDDYGPIIPEGRNARLVFRDERPSGEGLYHRMARLDEVRKLREDTVNWVMNEWRARHEVDTYIYNILSDVVQALNSHGLTERGVYKAFNNKSITTALQEHLSDETRHITSTERSKWNGKQDKIDSITLTDKARGSVNNPSGTVSIPTTVSLTESDIPALPTSRITNLGNYVDGRIYNILASWDGEGGGGGGGCNCNLNNYLPLAGGTMTGNIDFYDLTLGSASIGLSSVLQVASSSNDFGIFADRLIVARNRNSGGRNIIMWDDHILCHGEDHSVLVDRAEIVFADDNLYSDSLAGVAGYRFYYDRVQHRLRVEKKTSMGNWTAAQWDNVGGYFS